METENKQEQKIEKEIAKDITKIEEKVEEKKITQKQADKEIKEEVKDNLSSLEKKTEKKEETKKEESKEEKKVEKKEIIKGPKKTEAIVKGRNLHISTKHSIAICNLIRNKNIDKAILILEQAEKMKIPIPMTGEIPHRKGKIMSGRYPIKAITEFIKLLKGLRANAIMNELELEKYKIFCKSNIASRPYRRFGKGRFKRTHIEMKLILPVKKKKKKSGGKK
jgi:ribosomal protein L22